MGAIGLDGLKSIPCDQRPTQEILADKAIGKLSSDGHIKTTLSTMVKLEWLGNGRYYGLGSGYFLTDAGAALVSPRRKSGPSQD
jgi:hypothetical protein